MAITPACLLSARGFPTDFDVSVGDCDFGLLADAFRTVRRAATLRGLGLLFWDREVALRFETLFVIGTSPVQTAIAATTEAPSQP